MNEIIQGDCLVEMAKIDPNSIDAIVTDPPYALTSNKRFKPGASALCDKSQSWGRGNSPFKSQSSGFMGQEWDSEVPGPRVWAEAIRVAKPGSHLLAFGGTRTFHRLACAIEDAGWEIRDTLGWLYGSGFPKSHDVSKAIDKAAGKDQEVIGPKMRPDGKAMIDARPNGFDGCHEGYDRPWKHDRAKVELQASITAPATDAARQWEGWGTALKPAWEPIILARKPLDGTVAENVQKWGTGAINVDGCRIGTGDNLSGGAFCGAKRRRQGYSSADSLPGAVPMSRLNNGACEYHQPQGRWPANLLHDGSEEVLELFPDSTSTNNVRHNQKDNFKFFSNGEKRPAVESFGFSDSGSAARFFYCAKASRAEREMGCEGMEAKSAPIPNFGSNGFSSPTGHPERETAKAKNNHPTVKPLALMRYLCRLVTPPNGLILDPFMGSGTTGMAAILEGFRFMGIEKEADYCEIAKRRIENAEKINENDLFPYALSSGQAEHAAGVL